MTEKNDPDTLDGDTKDKLWGELKLKWKALKRGSNSNDEQKLAAKKRINEIQDLLGLDKTDFEAPYEGGKTRETAKKVNTNDVGPNYSDKDLKAILGATLDSKRLVLEKLADLEDKVTAILDRLPPKER